MVSEADLVLVIEELAAQRSVGVRFPPSILDFDGHIAQLRDSVAHDEPGLAVGLITAMLRQYPFVLTGENAIRFADWRAAVGEGP